MQITGGFLRSRKIIAPKTANVRPTLSQVRESVYSTLYSMIDFDGKTFLDAFAGSGIMGFEAISRGFAKVTFIEKDKKTFLLLKENIQKLGLNENQYSLNLSDTKKYLKASSQTQFDVIYVDPPYQSGIYNEIISTIQTNNLLSENGILIIEHPKNLELNFLSFNLLKQKNYSDKMISFLGL